MRRLPLFILALIAFMLPSTKAAFLEFSKANLRSLNLTDPKEPSFTARPINSNVDIDYEASTDQPQKVARFKEIPLLNPSERSYHDYCKNFVGLYMDVFAQYFCRPKTFSVRVDQYPDLPGNILGVQFKVYFSSTETEPFVLKVPVMKAPPRVVGFDRQSLINWSIGERVGVVAPGSVKILLEAAANKKMKLNFFWLKDLLNFGVTASLSPSINPRTEAGIKTYVTRPLLVKEEYLEACVKLVQSVKHPVSKM